MKKEIYKIKKSFSRYDLEDLTYAEICDYLANVMSTMDTLSFESDYSEINVMGTSLETDAEYTQRISAEKIRKETIEANERLQYLKLKEKYDEK